MAYDCLKGEECLLRILPMFLAADNPMHAKLCSHAGLGSNFPCRTCEVGGTKEMKRSNEGYLRLFEVSGYILKLSFKSIIFT